MGLFLCRHLFCLSSLLPAVPCLWLIEATFQLQKTNALCFSPSA